MTRREQRRRTLLTAEDFFDSSTREAATQRFAVERIVGKGSFGTVCVALDNLTGERVAIKRIHEAFADVSAARRVLRELRVLRALGHAPDVVALRLVVLPPNPATFEDVYIVFECFEGDLHNAILLNDDLTAEHHKAFAYQLLRGVAAVHAAGVLHRDLKPQNVLVNGNCRLKVCDFGLARVGRGPGGDESEAAWSDYIATRWYRAPELCGEPCGFYTEAVDVWSAGCIFAEMLLGRPLFPGRCAAAQLELIEALLGGSDAGVLTLALARKFPGQQPATLDLLRRLLAVNPAERCTAAQALRHPYFESVSAIVSNQAAKVQVPVQVQVEVQVEVQARVAAGTATDNTQVPAVGTVEVDENRLTLHEVRELVYLEALRYHPQSAAQYVPGCCRPSSSLAAQLEMFSCVSRRQRAEAKPATDGPGLRLQLKVRPPRPRKSVVTWAA